MESLRALVDQNRSYGETNETKIKDTIEQYQQELLQQRTFYENQNIQYLDQISSLQTKV